MALSGIIDFIKAKLLTLDGIDLVQSYQPVATEPAPAVAVMGASGSRHFWSVRREATSEERRTNRETERHHTIVVRAYYELGEPEISEPLFQALLEDAMALFREDFRVGPAAAPIAELFGPMQLTEVGWRILGSTSTMHYAQMTLQAQELIRRIA